MHTYDLLVIGGGINGVGIARDAAGRGLKVLLAEKGDLASQTSSWSSKLIHGGLRYLELYEFRLVAEALAEREIVLNIAPHLVWPARFIMPHVPDLLPRWMIRMGLFLYDHLSRRSTLEGSHGIDLSVPPYDSGLKPGLRHGFMYSDCRVDDARLVVTNAMSAREQGAQILTQTACARAQREQGEWRIELVGDGKTSEVRARAVVNAAGPWVKEVLNGNLGQPSRDAVRLIKGSHIVMGKRYEGEHAFILQNDDRRVVFMIPYERNYTLIGTTDILLDGDPGDPHASAEEIAYLCRAANRYLANPVAPADVVWTYSGVRPLYDDGTSDPSKVTRDYTLRVDDVEGRAPVLSVFGGKITTYRRLAEHVMDRLAPYFPDLKPAWTGTAPLPGGDFHPAARREVFLDLARRYPRLPSEFLHGVHRRHGLLATQIAGDAKTAEDLGAHFGAGLYEREVRYLCEHEWARDLDDILWRRTKCGLHMTPDERTGLAGWIATH
ncbi:MAG: glycerol-3-phosphate dehydrogenase [Betaproteobacteria bacterium]|nr:glycerol-3-phosphate dehydrogenase [Betaproteobacteria bacterium]